MGRSVKETCWHCGAKNLGAGWDISTNWPVKVNHSQYGVSYDWEQFFFCSDSCKESWQYAVHQWEAKHPIERGENLK